MSAADGAVTRAVPVSFVKTLAAVRRILTGAGFSIIKEFDLSKEPYLKLGASSGRCVVLLVDIPVLLFEAIALDRAAAVFLPLHVVVSGGREMSCLRWADPVSSSGLRPPAPSREALDALCQRLRAALASLPPGEAASAPR